MTKFEDFYRGKRVLVTGHTGFKGSWMCRALVRFGAEVCGYSLEPPTNPSLFELADIDGQIKSVIGDIRNFDDLKETFDEFRPEIVIHMAAQPLVRESYKNPVYTYSTNVMGTVNICEAVRLSPCVKSFVNVTTDKVYDNKERENEGYREEEPLDGYDPYSNSKSCSELVTHSYKKSFFNNMDIAVSTARAGNVIGGGDYATDRIIPDCIRAATKGEAIHVRNPHSTRPYQHVLEPVFAYLMIAMCQYENRSFAGYYNVGPDDDSCVTTGRLVDMFCSSWGDITWYDESDNGPHEAGFLKLDCSKLKKTFGWSPVWKVQQAIEKTVEFAKSDSYTDCMDKQILEYLDLFEKRIKNV